jgi:hypothetical protein
MHNEFEHDRKRSWINAPSSANRVRFGDEDWRERCTQKLSQIWLPLGLIALGWLPKRSNSASVMRFPGQLPRPIMKSFRIRSGDGSI